MLSGPYRRRARPVGDAPIDPLLANVEELAKAWLLTLLERAPLEEASRILAADLARQGPRVLDAVIRAIGTDADQRRIEPGGALVPLVGRVGELAGAADAESASQAVDALQSVIWAALRAELRDPEATLVSELAERLAQVAGLVRSAALRQGAEPDPGPGLTDIPEPWPDSSWPRTTSRTAASWPAEPAYDARRGPARESFEPPRESSVPRSEPPGPPPDPAASMTAAAPSPPSDRSWLDSRVSGPAGDALWVRALEEEIERSAGASLSLLLVELEDAERVRAVEDDETYAATLSEFNHALSHAVRRGDLLVCETPARAWIIARDTTRGGAQALGQQITSGVSRSRPWRGAPLIASLGIAVLGEDGKTPGELIEAAEEARFAADASGRPA